MSAGRQCIVLARAENCAEWDGQPFASDLGQRPKFVPTRRAVAMVWLNAGDASDEEKARAFAASDGYTVFTYAVGEADPLGKARAAVLA